MWDAAKPLDDFDRSAILPGYFCRNDRMIQSAIPMMSENRPPTSKSRESGMAEVLLSLINGDATNMLNAPAAIIQIVGVRLSGLCAMP